MNGSLPISRMTAAIRKDRFWLNRTIDGREQAEARLTVQPDLISSSLPENHKHKHLVVN
jgi:hypothetical protein